MSFQLAANRVMGICAFGKITKPDSNAKLLSTNRVAKEFLAQMGSMASDKLPTIIADIIDAFDEWGAELKPLPPDDRELDLTVFRDTSAAVNAEVSFGDAALGAIQEPTRDPIVGLFKSYRYKMRFENMDWDLRIRPSVTACVLERADRLSKLWWTYEAVPADLLGAPHPQSCERFVKMTTEISETALPALRRAYIDALDPHKRQSECKLEFARLRVSLLDNTELPFSKLVDAMLLSGVSFAEAAGGKFGADTQEGARMVVRFIEETTKQKLNPAIVKLATRGPGLAAVHCNAMPEADLTKSEYRYVIAGLASAINMISSNLPTSDEWKKRSQSPDLIRSISAARPLSAALADIAARGLDRFARSRQALVNG